MFFLSSLLNQVFARQTITINKEVKKDVIGNADESDGHLDEKSNLADPSCNIVNIVSGGTVKGNVIGGMGVGYDNHPSNNIVSIDGGEVTGDVYGGKAYHENGTAIGNAVRIADGYIVGNLVCGGFVENHGGNVSNNIVTINGGFIEGVNDTGLIVGGQTAVGNAINNSVTVNGGEVLMDVFGGRVLDVGDATGNTVTINGGKKIESRIVCGGFSNSGNATGNKVTIAQKHDVDIGFLCGGLTPDGDAVTGNTLCMKTSGLKVKGVGNFQNYDFCLPADINTGDLVLFSKNGGQRVDDDNARSIDLVDRNINVSIDCRWKRKRGGLLQSDDYFLLIKSPEGFETDFPDNQKPTTLKQGFAFRYDCKLSIDKDETSEASILKLLVVGNAKFNKEVKLFSEGRAASVAFLNQGSDIISDRGLSEAVTSVSPNSVESVSCFTATSGVKLKYNTGSYAKVNGISALTGLAKGIDVKFGKLTTGAFFEYGSSNYNTSTNSFSGFSSVEGGGNAGYKGGGVLGYFDFRNNFYGEVSGRIGSITTEFYSLGITYTPDVFAKYNCDTQYVGAHVGGGYLWDINNKLRFNLYGKCFFTHQNGKDVVLPTSEVVKFADTNSKRVRVGAKFSNNVNKGVSLYCGVAYEYELDGIVNATMSGRSIFAPSLEGGTGIGEIGVKGSVGTCSVDLSAQGYTGSREGFSGMLRFSFAFFNYTNRFLGYSLEKFYDKENTRRFNQMFNMSKKECFDKSLDIIKELKARVTHKSFRKGYIVAFDFSKSFKSLCLDSTEACIFITETESRNVNVEVVSTNSFFAQAVSVEFFKMLGQDNSVTDAS